MADVFISYSKLDSKLAISLADDLAAAGYSVWWDTNLVSGEEFRDVIDQELDAAKTAVVIWTPISVASKWVRSEADHADRQRKLITVRTSDLSTHKIPKPYNTIHSDLVTDRKAILKAIARFAPPNPPTPAPPPSQPAEISALSLREALALEHWQAVKGSATPQPLYTFLGEFGNTSCAKLARARIEQLSGAVWTKLRKTRSIEALDHFLADFPDTSEAEIARRRHLELRAPPPDETREFPFDLSGWAPIAVALVFAVAAAPFAHISAGKMGLTAGLSQLSIHGDPTSHSAIAVTSQFISAFTVALLAVVVVAWRGAASSPLETALYWLGASAAICGALISAFGWLEWGAGPGSPETRWQRSLLSASFVIAVWTCTSASFVNVLSRPKREGWDRGLAAAVYVLTSAASIGVLVSSFVLFKEFSLTGRPDPLAIRATCAFLLALPIIGASAATLWRRRNDVSRPEIIIHSGAVSAALIAGLYIGFRGASIGMRHILPILLVSATGPMLIAIGAAFLLLWQRAR